MEIFRAKGMEQISQDELALYIAKHIGSSKFYGTVRNYISYMMGFRMIEQTDDKRMFKINYNVIDDD